MAKRLTEQEKLYRAIKEATFQKRVQGLLDQYGWRWYHSPDNRPTRGGFIQNIRAGFPDLVAVRGSRVLWIELKAELGKRTPDQVEWADALIAAGQEYYLWRPSDEQIIHGVLHPEWMHPTVVS